MSETTNKARALLAAAWPGPWRVRGESFKERTLNLEVVCRGTGTPDGPTPTNSTGELITAAPELLAALIAELDAAERRAVEAEAGAAALRDVLTRILQHERPAVMGLASRAAGPACRLCGLADMMHADDCPGGMALATDAGRAILDRLERAEAERDASRTAAENAYAAQLAAESERDILRVVVSECAAAIGNGSGCSVDASVGFMATVPAEIRAELSALRVERAELTAKVRRMRRDVEGT